MAVGSCRVSILLLFTNTSHLWAPSGVPMCPDKRGKGVKPNHAPHMNQTLYIPKFICDRICENCLVSVTFFCVE